MGAQAQHRVGPVIDPRLLLLFVVVLLLLTRMCLAGRLVLVVVVVSSCLVLVVGVPIPPKSSRIVLVVELAISDIVPSVLVTSLAILETL